MRLGPWVQSEAPRLSLGRGGEPRAHSVPRSRIFPRPHSSDIADTTLPHALTLLLLGYSSETWWQSRLASSTRRFAQVSRQALPPLAASPARSRSALRRDTQPRELTHADQRPRPPLTRPQRRAATCAPHAAPLTRRPSRWLTHWPLCRRRLAFLVRLSYFEGGADRCTRQCRCRLGSAVAGSMCPAFNVPRWHAGRVSLPRREVSAPAGHNVSVLARPRGLR